MTYFKGAACGRAGCCRKVRRRPKWRDASAYRAATVSEWKAQLESGGLAALKSRPRGRPAGLDAAQRRELMRALTGGAVADGFATDLWTLRRVGQLIERHIARPYSKSQV